MKKFNVMIFPCGAENALEVNDALKYHIDIEVWGGSSVDDHGKFAYTNPVIQLPFISEPDFIAKLNQRITEHAIGYIIPTHDTVALFLAQNQGGINTKIVCSDANTSLICRNKRLTYELFSNTSFCPAIFDPRSVSSFPVFLKPNLGEGGKGTSIVHDMDTLLRRVESNPQLIVVEFLPGDEITIDCFTNYKNELLFVGPRTRERVTMGIAFHSETIKLTDDIYEIASTINQRLKINGLWFFQLKKDKEGKYKLLEVSTRCAGTMSLYRQRGINFPLLAVMNTAGVEVQILDNGNPLILDRSLRSRYDHNINYDTVYLDFDDTVIINGQVNIIIMTFLYQCVNQKKKVILLTRHEKVIHDTLSYYKISESLFHSIQTLTWEQTKCDLITEQQSIFIDNSFAERAEVSKKIKIPVFDVDAVGSLITV